MTAEEFYSATRGFYDVLERIADTFEWMAEEMYRQADPAASARSKASLPPHLRAQQPG
jgi:hypothetical protein